LSTIPPRVPSLRAAPLLLPVLSLAQSQWGEVLEILFRGPTGAYLLDREL